MRHWLAAILLLLVSGAAQAATTLNRGNGGEPMSLDPHFVGTAPEANIVGDLLVGLITLDAAARPIPGAADSWNVSADGLTWIFHLREENWSDGVPVTADDFVFAWRRLLDPKTAARGAANLWLVKNARAISAGKLPLTMLGVTAADPHSLVVRLEHPAPYLPQLLTVEAALPLPRHVLATGSPTGDTIWARPGRYVGNGPYLLKEWIPGDHITLVRNPHFYDAAHVGIDTVNYYPTGDSEAALKRYRTGELDTMTPVPTQEIAWLRAKGQLSLTPSLGLSYIAINLDDPALKDARVRRALNLVYNREAVVQKLLKLGEAPAYGIVPPGMANYPGLAAMDFRSEPYPARVADAQRLMQAAGYGPFNRLHLTYAAWPNPDVRRLAAVFQAMCRTIYVDLAIQTTDLPVLMHNLSQHQFQLSTASWFADFDDASNFLDLLHTGNTNNYADYRNPRFDAALDAAQLEADGKKRAALLLAAEKIALADYPWIPWRFAVQSDLVKPYVRGWVQNARDYHRSRWLRLQN